ncbi:MAG: hypothetical protein ACE5EJ_01495 [Nitrosopumilaceae archaeon]
MTLANLIDDLKQAVQDGKVDRRNAQELVEGRVILPYDFNAERAEVKFEDFNFGDKHPTSLYHLGISAFPKRSLDEVQPVLDEFFTRAKGLKLGKGVADVTYGVFWTPETFQDEKKLTGLFFDEVKVESRAYTCDPPKVRIGMPGQSHKIEATTQANKMILKATGNYRGQLEGLVETFNPQYAKLNLSNEDAGRLLRAVRNTPIGKYVAGRLEKALQPEERHVMSLSLGGGISFGTQEVIELAVPTRVLRQYEEAIGKPLIVVSPKQDSQVTEFIKVYGLGGILRGERLSDLQYLARSIPEMNLGIVYGSPVVTLGQAKELLESEIELMTKGYESIFGLGMNSHMRRGGVVKRLAREHFGGEVVDKFDELGVWDYVDFLKVHGYDEPRAEDVESESTRKIYADLRVEGRIPDRAFANEPEYIAKERHLLEFFKQSYAKDPRESVQRFREFYQNSEPEMRIFARGRGKDASKLRKLKLPPKSRLVSFGITEHMNRATPYSNDLTISRTLPSNDDVHFWSRTSVDNPMLLGLQEYACREMGVQFK